jgi:plastocyanin
MRPTNSSTESLESSEQRYKLEHESCTPENRVTAREPIGSRRTFLRTIGAGGSVTVFSGLAGCTSLGIGSNSSDSVEGTLVKMTSEFTYEPSSVEIPVGEQIVWRMKGFTSHTVTAYEMQIPENAEYFASGGFSNEQAARDGFTNGKGSVGYQSEYKRAFEVPGRYKYFCIPHESSMKGAIIVKSTE